jgi:hypothetical protein
MAFDPPLTRPSLGLGLVILLSISSLAHGAWNLSPQSSSDLPRFLHGNEHSSFGSIVSDIGDVDADGVPDLLIADPDEEVGRVWIVSVRKRKALYSVPALPDGYEFTTQVRAAGDVDGDGTPDWILGGYSQRGESSSPRAKAKARPSSDEPRWSHEPSCALVFSGKTGMLLHHFSEERAGQQLGRCIAAAGDLDHDGHADIVLGARRSTTGAGRSGVACVRSGRDGSTLLTLGESEPLGQEALAVEGVGDVDRDGIPDIAVACGSQFEPVIAVYSGKSAKELFRLPGPRTFGWSLRCASDLDHDGSADLLVGWGGFARLCSARDDRTILRVSSALAEDGLRHALGDWYGSAVAILRGTAQDSIPTLVVSATETNVWGGTLYFYSASNGSVLTQVDDMHLSKIRFLESPEKPATPEEVHHLGSSLANLGDVDGDGYDDLACGVDNTEGAVDGHAFVFSGSIREPIYELRRRGDEVVVFVRQ